MNVGIRRGYPWRYSRPSKTRRPRPPASAPKPARRLRATRTLARKQDAEALRVVKLAEPEGETARIAAGNSRSEAVVAIELEKSRLAALRTILGEMVKPAEKINGIPISQIGGLGRNGTDSSNSAVGQTIKSSGLSTASASRVERRRPRFLGGSAMAVSNSAPEAVEPVARRRCDGALEGAPSSSSLLVKRIGQPACPRCLAPDPCTSLPIPTRVAGLSWIGIRAGPELR